MRDAVRLCITPFEAAFEIIDVTLLRADFMESLSLFAARVAMKFLIAVLIIDLTARLRALRRRLCRCRFSADACVAKVVSFSGELHGFFI